MQRVLRSVIPFIRNVAVFKSSRHVIRPVGAWLVTTDKSSLITGTKHIIRLYSSPSDKTNYRQSNPKPDDSQQQPDEKWSWNQIIPGIAIGLLYYMFTSQGTDVIPNIPYSFFLKYMLQFGEVEKLVVSNSRDFVYIYLYPGAVINGRLVHPNGPQFVMSISSVESFENKLKSAQDDMGIPQDNRIPIKYKSTSENLYLLISGLITVSIFGAVWYFLARKVDVTVKFSNPFSFMTSAKTTIVTNPSQIGTKFADVAGMQEAKAEVMEFVDYLKNPSRFSELGARIPKGALLHGPPGTGKTLLARAIASEAYVPFISIAGPDFVEMFAGVGSARVRDLFSQARTNSPCILYIDEIDAVGRTRQSGPAVEGTSEQENTLNQLLVEMDGINTLEGVVILASTNRVDILDQALLRPGRFDRQIAIDMPTLPERKEIFEVYLKKVSLEKSYEEYSARLAALTPGHSGADIANIVNEAALHAARIKSSKVTENNFEYAIERVIAGMEKKNSTLSREEREVIAYHESGHALIGWLLEHTDPILKVTIVPRTKGILGFAQYLPSDQKLYTTEQLVDRMCMTLGGRAAEAIVFKRITTGARDDLEKVTKMAYRQVAEFGMSRSVGHISVPLVNPSEPAKRFYSNKLARMIDEEVRVLVDSAYNRAETILKDNRHLLEKLAQSLLEREVLNYKDLVEILGKMPYKKTHHHQYTEIEHVL